jgi:hypothetical protein
LELLQPALYLLAQLKELLKVCHSTPKSLSECKVRVPTPGCNPGFLLQDLQVQDRGGNVE